MPHAHRVLSRFADREAGAEVGPRRGSRLRLLRKPQTGRCTSADHASISVSHYKRPYASTETKISSGPDTGHFKQVLNRFNPGQEPDGSHSAM